MMLRLVIQTESRSSKMRSTRTICDSSSGLLLLEVVVVLAVVVVEFVVAVGSSGCGEGRFSPPSIS